MPELIADDREGWHSVTVRKEWTCPRCEWTDLPLGGIPGQGWPLVWRAAVQDGVEGRQCPKCGAVFPPSESREIEWASRLNEEKWAARSERSRHLIDIGRELYQTLLRQEYSAEQAEEIYQTYRFVVMIVTGVHFDDFGRPGRSANEDGALAELVTREAAR